MTNGAGESTSPVDQPPVRFTSMVLGDIAFGFGVLALPAYFLYVVLVLLATPTAWIGALLTPLPIIPAYYVWRWTWDGRVWRFQAAAAAALWTLLAASGALTAVFFAVGLMVLD